MGLFGFGKKRAKKQAEEAVEDQKDQSKELDESKDAEESTEKSDLTTEADRDETAAEQDEAEQSGKGPWDSMDPEAPDTDEYLDIGALMLPFLQGSELRLKANSQTGDVLGATITYKSSSLELEPFAAPKSRGVWDEVRADLLKALLDGQHMHPVTEQMALNATIDLRGRRFPDTIVWLVDRFSEHMDQIMVTV
ncbi:MAG: DUF3710 domain-containing protein, partial [Bifidobacterium sp.]|nr:DUF3710 domain-containing protein [Bifidobacterium sp.]